MSIEIKEIIIIGGGSAGWMAATTLIRNFPNKKITLIESPDISTVGVGESTIGGISSWLEGLGLNDISKFAKETDATLKLSIRFEDFYKKGDGGFHYPFGSANYFGTVLGANDWCVKKVYNPEIPSSDFADCYNAQMALVNNNKLADTFPNFDFKKDKALHFDATKFGQYLKNKICIPEGVNYILSEVVDVKLNEEGSIESIKLKNNNILTADLFIDCTGFTSFLLSKTLKEPFVSYEDILPNNSAWATRLPYKDKEKEINSYTNCTAIENGWVWQIPLWSRWGTGYVYSDKYVDEKTALKEFKNFIVKKGYGDLTESLEFRKLKMRVGLHERIWVKNVVAIGLSAGFIEPLESNGLYTVHEFLRNLVVILKRRNYISQFDKGDFNSKCVNMFVQFSRFVASHYALSHRNDTPYWRDISKRDWSVIDKTWTWETFYNQLSQSRTLNNDGYLFLAMGMNCFPVTEQSLIDDTCNKNFKEDNRHELKSRIDFLNKRKEDWNNQAQNCKSTYQFLKDKYYS